MSSIFSVNQLGMGLTMPIKMRRLIERPASGKTQAFNKLAQILCEKMYSRPMDKEEKKNERKSVEFSGSNLKNRRVYSQKSASQKKETTHNSGNDRYFNEFFEQFQSNPKTTDKVFKPYHHNQPKEMNRTQILTPSNSRKKALTVIKKQSRIFKQIDTNEPSIDIGKWEIKQEMQNFSLLYAKSLKKE